MGESTQYFPHRDPVWRGRANALVQAPLQEPDQMEQLWCERLGEDLFRVCCIPFFLYDVALGDGIHAPEYRMRRLVSRSGRFVFRALFRPDQFDARRPVIDGLQEVDALFEWYSAGLLSIDAVGEREASIISTFLREYQNLDLLTYETGAT